MPVHTLAGTPREIGYGSCSPDFLVSEEAMTRTVYVPRAVVITFLGPAGTSQAENLGKTEKAEGREDGRQWPEGLGSKLPLSEDCKGCTFVTNVALCVGEDRATTYPAQRFQKDQLCLISFLAEKAQPRRTFDVTISVMCCGLHLYLQTKTSSCLDN